MIPLLPAHAHPAGGSGKTVLRGATPADVPVDLDRDEAAREARRELAHPDYHQDDPSLLERAVDWILRQLTALLERAASASPGGWLGLLLLLAVLVAAVVVIRWRLGPLARTATAGSPLFGDSRLSAQDHRRLSEEAERAGDLRTAVAERFRATVRGLEERGVLDERPGRTAHEVATEAGRVLSGEAGPLARAADVFDRVRYGGHVPSATDVEDFRALDDRLRHSRQARVLT